MYRAMALMSFSGSQSLLAITSAPLLRLRWFTCIFLYPWNGYWHFGFVSLTHRPAILRSCCAYQPWGISSIRKLYYGLRGWRFFHPYFWFCKGRLSDSTSSASSGSSAQSTPLSRMSACVRVGNDGAVGLRERCFLRSASKTKLCTTHARETEGLPVVKAPLLNMRNSAAEASHRKVVLAHTHLALHRVQVCSESIIQKDGA